MTTIVFLMITTKTKRLSLVVRPTNLVKMNNATLSFAKHRK